LALSFFILLKDIGFGEAIIKSPSITKSDIDTFWTIRFFLSLCIALALALSSSWIASFLKDPRIEEVLFYMAFIPVIDAFNSPASALLLRDLRYGTNFLLKSSDKIVRVIAVIVAAIILRSYWALVIGAVLSSFFGVMISQIARPYVPRVSLSSIKQHGNFAFWSYVRSISNYISRTADEFIVRGTQSTAFFGVYHIARDLSRVLITEIVAPIREAMLPALSKLQHQPSRFGHATANIIGAAAIIAVAVSVGIAMTAKELTLVLLGNQWAAAGPFLSVLAIGVACNALGHVNQSSFIATNRNTLGAKFWLFRAVLYSAGCVIAALLYTPEIVATTFTVLSVVVYIAETTTLLRIVQSKRTFLALVVRPVLGGGLMAVTLTIMPWPTDVPVFWILLLKVGLGAGVYCTALLIFWRLASPKDGPEDALLQYLPGPLRRIGALFAK
jgi:O-antigen/teichoic acid export membrane protein